MKEVQITKLNSAVTTSDSAYHSYVTSAVSTDTQRYVIVDSDEMPDINMEETGKYSVFDIANWFLLKGEMTQKKLQKLC